MVVEGRVLKGGKQTNGFKRDHSVEKVIDRHVVAFIDALPFVNVQSSILSNQPGK